MNTAPDFLQSITSWGTLISAVGTCVAALLAICLGWPTVKISRRSQYDARFYKAVELLASPTIPARVSAVITLVHLAEIEPQFGIHVRDVLVEHLRERSRIDPGPAGLDILRATEALAQLPLPAGSNSFDLTRVSWRGLNFKQHSILRDFPPAVLDDADFSGTIFDGMSFLECSCKSSDFSNATVNNATFPKECDLIKFFGANGLGVIFRESSLKDAKFAGTKFPGVNFEDADLSGADLEAAGKLEAAEMLNAICSYETKFIGTKLRGVHTETFGGASQYQFRQAVLSDPETIEQSVVDERDIPTRAGISAP